MAHKTAGQTSISPSAIIAAHASGHAFARLQACPTLRTANRPGPFSPGSARYREPTTALNHRSRHPIRIAQLRVPFRTFPAGPVRTAMCWMGAGALLGLAYCGHKAAQSALQAGCVLALVAGLLWPVAVRWPLVRHLLAYRTYR
jgi:hypothetical protein